MVSGIGIIHTPKFDCVKVVLLEKRIVNANISFFRSQDVSDKLDPMG